MRPAGNAIDWDAPSAPIGLWDIQDGHFSP